MTNASVCPCSSGSLHRLSLLVRAAASGGVWGLRWSVPGTHRSLKELSLPLSPAAESAEPHDNTTYKNLQHHDYGAYTFLDLNLDLSKFRLPQPSSGRESPRH